MTTTTKSTKKPAKAAPIAGTQEFTQEVKSAIARANLAKATKMLRTVTATMETSQYGNPIPTLRLHGYSLGDYRRAHAALYRLAANISEACEGHDWAVDVATSARQIRLELSNNDDAPAALAVLERFCK